MQLCARDSGDQAPSSSITHWTHNWSAPLVCCLLLQGYAFQMEVIVRAQYKGFRIVELPIIFVDRLFGESKLGAGEYVQFLTGLARLALTL